MKTHNPLSINLFMLSVLLSGLGIPLYANGLTIDPTSASLKPGESIEFSATTENVDSLQWVTVKGNMRVTRQSVRADILPGVVMSGGELQPLTGTNVRYTAPHEKGTYSVAVTDGSAIAVAVVTVEEPEYTIILVEILGGDRRLTVGATQALSLQARLTDLSQQDYTDRATWQSNDPSILEVSPKGLLTALKPGTATLSASVGEQTAQIQITVEAEAAVGLVIEPSPVYLPTAGQQTLNLSKILRDNRQQPVDSADCRFSSNAQPFVTVNNSAELQALSPGSAVIKVDCDDLHASVPVFVSSPFELATNPEAFTLGVEDSKSFQIIGGMPPYQVTAHTGRVSGSGESWRYQAALIATDDIVTITDQAGAQVDLNVTVTKGMMLSPMAVDLPPNTTKGFVVSGGLPPYRWRVSAGELNKLEGTDVSYTAPEVRGVYEITVNDKEGHVKTAVINVGAGLIATPNQFIMEPEEAKRFQITGGEPPYTISATSGTYTQEEDEAYYYTAPSVSGDYSLVVRDAEGRNAIIAVTVASALKVTPSELFLQREEEAELNLSGGHGDYVTTLITGKGKTEGGKLTYTAANVAGRDVITIIDEAGAVVQVNVLVSTTGFYVSPIESYKLPGETIQVRALGGTPPYSWKVSGEGRLSSEQGERVTFTASDIAEKVNIVVTDNTGQETKSHVIVYQGELQITPQSLALAPGEEAKLQALLGLDNYTWRADNGKFSTTEGETVTYTAPTDADEDVIRLEDASGKIKTLRVVINSDTCEIVNKAIENYFNGESEIDDRINLFLLLEQFLEENETMACK